MKALALLFLLSALGLGCGGSPEAKPPATVTPPPATSGTTADTSIWAGTFTGNLNFSGCPTPSPCGGDVVTVTIAEAANAAIPGEFVPALTATGTDNGAPFTATGTATYYGAPPVGGTATNGEASLLTNTAHTLFLTGTGTSTSDTVPVYIDTIVVNNYVTVAGVPEKGAEYFGTLYREAKP